MAMSAVPSASKIGDTKAKPDGTMRRRIDGYRFAPPILWASSSVCRHLNQRIEQSRQIEAKLETRGKADREGYERGLTQASTA